MALSASRLSSAIHAQIVAQFGAAANDTWLQEFCDAIATCVVTEITANAQVNGPVTVASVSGVAPGTSVSGPGAGTVVNAAVT